MYPRETLKLLIIFICVWVHASNILTLPYFNAFLEQQAWNFTLLQENPVMPWHLLEFTAKVSGCYCLGYLADRIGFFKTMKLITLGYLFLAGLAFGIYFFSIKINSLLLITLIRSCRLFLKSAIVLPLLYLCRFYTPLKHYQISALMLVAIMGGTLTAYYGNSIYSFFQWAGFLIIPDLVILGFCIYLAKQTSIEKITRMNSASFSSKVMAILIIGVGSIGLSYTPCFTDWYMSNVMIATPSSLMNFIILLSLFPSAYFAKIMGPVRTMTFSMIGIFVAMLLLMADSYIVHQVVFGIGFSLFLAPSLAYVYSVLKGFQSYAKITLFFGFTHVSFILFATYAASLRMMPPPFIGAALMISMMAACIGIQKKYKVLH
jgi:hypothetical protein